MFGAFVLGEIKNKYWFVVSFYFNKYIQKDKE